MLPLSFGSVILFQIFDNKSASASASNIDHVDWEEVNF